ncbi:MAG: D-alanyl-D-alanine carboxypeptidase [Streptomyces sp.]|jgi:D-alanyl-D-alanine carboxypeptidase (penicillin-binding protein 5/6)|nr:D-alanyl-D-alanine carboxypeptidase [Streptomyces sp.]
MRDSFLPTPRAVRMTRRAVLGLAAAAPLALAAPASASPGLSIVEQGGTTEAVGGERLGRPGVQAQRTVGLPTELTARSWLVADHDSGEVLAAFHAHDRLPPASTLKMLFADTVLKKFERTRTYQVTDEDLADVPEGSSLVGVKPGITYTVEQLWLGVFLRSGNDAVHVLSHMNGGIARTVAEMQAQARDLQALDTHVVSPDGFDHEGQLSSAYDLTLFARHGLRNADFRGYCATRTADFPDEDGRTFQIQNTDRLLTGTWGLGTYQGLFGVKNGYTSNAGNTFTGAATRGGRTLLVTVMHPRPGGNSVYEETAALLDWGFTRGATTRAVGSLVEPLSDGGPSTAPGPAKAPEGTSETKAPSGAKASTEVSGSLWGRAVGVGAGVGGAVALLAAGGAYVLRGRRRGAAAESMRGESARGESTRGENMGEESTREEN